MHGGASAVNPAAPVDALSLGNPHRSGAVIRHESGRGKNDRIHEFIGGFLEGDKGAPGSMAFTMNQAVHKAGPGAGEIWRCEIAPVAGRPEAA
jgi:hypothetical protein